MGLWNLWVPAKLARTYAQDYFYVYEWLISSFGIVDYLNPILRTSLFCILLFCLTLLYSFYLLILDITLFYLLQITDELKEQHPHWPWSSLLPHTPLSNTDYAYIAVESGR